MAALASFNTGLATTRSALPLPQLAQPSSALPSRQLRPPSSSVPNSNSLAHRSVDTQGAVTRALGTSLLFKGLKLRPQIPEVKGAILLSRARTRFMPRVKAGEKESSQSPRVMRASAQRADDGSPRGNTGKDRVARDTAERAAGRGVVITGGCKGLGLAMAMEFVSAGDRVVVCARSEEQLLPALGALQAHAAAELGGEAAGGSAAAAGTVCDVGRIEDVAALGRFAQEHLGTVHVWINNAGQVTSKRMLADVPPEEIVSAVAANVTGSLLGTREAIRVMLEQPAGTSAPGAIGPPYRIFNLGFSKWGAAFTKSAATHKATKTALTQLNTSLSQELKEAGITSISVHNLSPGMVLTDLLLKDSTPVARRFFNALAEEPETVAADLVARVRSMDPSEPSGSSLDYLTPASAVLRVLSRVPQIINGGRFFDKEGNRVPTPGQAYAPNGVKLQLPAGTKAKS